MSSSSFLVIEWGSKTFVLDIGSDIYDTFISTDGKYDYLVLSQPTSLLRNASQIDEAIELLETKQADTVISVREMNHSPLWSNTLTEDGNMHKFLSDEVKNRRSQDLEKYYRLNGAIYICKTEKLLKVQSFFLKENIFAYEMKREHSIDVDKAMDLAFIKMLMSEK